jgi:hypothetical protein
MGNTLLIILKDFYGSKLDNLDKIDNLKYTNYWNQLEK